MNIFGGYYETERGWKHYRVQGKTYDVQFNPRTLEGNVLVHITYLKEFNVNTSRKYKMEVNKVKELFNEKFTNQHIKIGE